MHIVQIKAECWWLHSNPEKEVPEDYFPLWIAINNPTATESIRGPQSLFINVPEFGPKPPAFANLQRATLITDPTQLRQDHFGHCLTSAIDGDSILSLATHRWDHETSSIKPSMDVGSGRIYRKNPGISIVFQWKSWFFSVFQPQMEASTLFQLRIP